MIEFDAYLKSGRAGAPRTPDSSTCGSKREACFEGAERSEPEGCASSRVVCPKPPLLPDGLHIADWTVLGFLGRGGSGEVYRVQRGNEIAAAKVLYKDNASARARFKLETEVLEWLGRGTRPACPRSCGTHDPTAFPRFVASGSIANRPYLITEFLQPAELPRTDAALADYLLQICRGLSALHSAGLVHRDLKPKNIMRRENGELVIIDIGLIKDTWRGTLPLDGVSIVSGKAVAVGSPGFGAPEQFQGGTISPLTDIHALGRIANAAFDNHPPRNWEEIIRRSTSSIPEQRYGSVEEFSSAIRHRNSSRRLKFAALVVLIAIIILSFGRAGAPRTPPRTPQPIAPQPASSDLSRFASLCHPTTITRIENELLWERLETNIIRGTTLVSPIRAYRPVTNNVDIIAVNLNGSTNIFTHPLPLTPGREYVFTGPGVFDVDLSVASNFDSYIPSYTRFQV